MAHGRPLLAIIAGGNGAGKSTFYQQYLKTTGLPFINADVLAREFWPEAPEERSYDAMLLAEEARAKALANGDSFCFESVFSHPSKLQFVHQARAAGYEIHLYVIHLQHADLNVGRVAQRVTEGGHHVPPEKVYSRIPRSLAQLQEAARLADQVVLLDNSRHDEPYIVQARRKSGQWTVMDSPASWAKEFVAKVP